MTDSILCPRCNTVKDVSNFSKDRNRKNGLQWSCKDCCANDKYLNRYGITRDRYYELLTEQHHRCAICGVHISDYTTHAVFAVDHDHTTGQVRGLLCQPCNVMLGGAKDNVDNLAKGIEYLNRMKI